MERKIRIALAQLNPTVGDLAGNSGKILEASEAAREMGADLVAFPELILPGYPPEDLLLRPRFVEDNLKALQQLAGRIRGITAVVGFVDREEDIFNAAAVIEEGKVAGVYRKVFLPNYGVFDEKRYFQAGQKTPVFVISGAKVGISICEDIWYPDGPANQQCLNGGAEVLLNISSSPYQMGKLKSRREMLAARASDNSVFLAYVNMVGGQDELVFDGRSMIFSPEGELLEAALCFEEDMLLADLDLEEAFRRRLHDTRRREQRAEMSEVLPRIVISEGSPAPDKPALPERSWEESDPAAEAYGALRLGTRDYVRKNGFQKVLLGLSGGVDSALTAAIAVDALGNENVKAVLMPSSFTSRRSLEDAGEVARRLEIELITIPIARILSAFLEELKQFLKDGEPGVTVENLQARIRGTLLMALSNRFGWLVLTTGNKSEMAAGYATLYGDMAGGFAVLRDIPKTMVYDLCRHRNTSGEVFPESILTREPTAELRENQKDSDSLPPYDILDPILKAYIEEDLSLEKIASQGFDPETVKRVMDLVRRSEYKRRQAPPGIKITPRAFGKDRRFPITCSYRES
jgi:NAD+ synthase (glutamine-hydrolysing)